MQNQVETNNKPEGMETGEEKGSDLLKELSGLSQSEEAESSGESEESMAETGEVAQTQEEPVTEVGTEQPFSFPTQVTQKQGLLIALGVVLVLLILLIADNVRRKKKKASKKSTSAADKDESNNAGTGTETEITATEAALEQSVKVPIVVAKVHEQGSREDQQDSLGISDIADAEFYRKKGMLAVVADGMGGLSNGGQVSSLSVRTCMDTFYDMPEHLSPADLLLEMASKANAQVNRMLRGGQRSGSTLVTAVLRDGYLYFLTIGDSRIYLYRGGALIQLNREHIYKEELALQAVNGGVPVNRVNADPQAKSLTSYLGNGRLPYLDRNQEGIKLVSGDRILLASDGVFGTATQELMESALALPAAEAADKIRKAIKAADKQYQDNYTALILEYK